MKKIVSYIRYKISSAPVLMKIINNASWLYFEKILRMGGGLVLGVWLARYLGPSQFGLLNFAQAFTGIFAALSTLGLQSIVVRDIVRDPENAPLTLGTSAILQFLGGLLAYILLIIGIMYLRPDDALARIIVAILGAKILLNASEIVVYWFESKVQSKYTVLVQAGVFLISSFIKIILILDEANIIFFAWVLFAEAAIQALILLLIMNRHGLELSSLLATIERAKMLLKDSWALMLSGVAVLIYMKIDQIMLGQMVGDDVVGKYSAAVKISEAWYFIPLGIVASVFPLILQAKARGQKIYMERIQKLYDLMVVMSLVVAIPMSFLALPLLRFVFGDAYADAAPTLIIYAWTSVFVFFGVVSGKWLLIENFQQLALQRTFLGAVINVCMNYWLIPEHGPTGAAIATLISYAFAGYFSDLLQDQTRLMFCLKTNSLNVLSILERVKNEKNH